MTVLLAGGGTAGHIEPALALADALRQERPDIGITCLGTERGLETRLVPARGYELALIPAVPLPRSLTPRLLTVPGRLAAAVNAAAGIIDRTGAGVVVGFGGYVATPAYLAARRRGIPIVIHEANPRPGLANRLGARFAARVFTGHPDASLQGGEYIGIPLRREIADLDRMAAGDKARSHFGLRTDRPTLLIFGGSQGARSLNRAALAAAPAFAEAGIQVLHAVGPKNVEETVEGGGTLEGGGTVEGGGRGLWDGGTYVTLPYIDRMDLAYAAADFALCRSGAMTCAELTAVGLPAAYVPLPHGNGEQELNAEPIVAAGGGLMVEDSRLSPEWLAEQVIPIVRDPDAIVRMSEAALRMGRRDADAELARRVLEIVS